MLGADDSQRRAAYRGLFRNAPEDRPLEDLRLAIHQDQPIGNDRFCHQIEAMTSQRRELRKRGRPKKQDEQHSADVAGQRALSL